MHPHTGPPLFCGPQPPLRWPHFRTQGAQRSIHLAQRPERLTWQGLHLSFLLARTSDVVTQVIEQLGSRHCTAEPMHAEERESARDKGEQAKHKLKIGE